MTQLANFVWSIADQLRGVYKPNKYGDVILPMTILRRMECVLAPHRELITSLAATAPPDMLELLVREETGLTLKRLDVWINEWRLRMRMMSVCVEGARGKILAASGKHSFKSKLSDAQGGALVNLIHSYTDNGDPFVRKFTDQLLEEVSSFLPSCIQKS